MELLFYGVMVLLLETMRGHVLVWVSGGLLSTRSPVHIETCISLVATLVDY